ncbi:MAG: hypothetical protein M1827_005346 [Pycnora praestabilis]|nr:MAG: hypothetical protein M1827_005346 [Pycnora praestabilis]
MGGNRSSGSASTDLLTVTRALEIARNSEEGAVDPTVSALLERTITEIWQRIHAQPDTYVLSKEEFAVFNYFRGLGRFPDSAVAQNAVRRFWDYFQGDASDVDATVEEEVVSRQYLTMRSPEAIVTCSLPNQSPFFSSTRTDTTCLGTSRTSSALLDADVSEPERCIKSHARDLEDLRNDPTHRKERMGTAPYVSLQRISAIVLRRSSLLQLFLALILLSAALLHFSTIRSPEFYAWTSNVLSRNNHYSAIPFTQASEVFQVTRPVIFPFGSNVERSPNARTSSATATAVHRQQNKCIHVETLMEHSFAFSYGKPFVGVYRPPPCTFNRIIFNLTVVSMGRQFDRLALMYFGDTEVFRTSTAEPTVNGIQWTYVKDMSSYLALFEMEQKVIFDLGNLVDDVYTASFNATLTASFFNSIEMANPADLILPISAQRSSTDRASAFSLPAENATTILSIPRNARRAKATISACGQGDEEFWFGNVLSSNIQTFPSAGPLFGHSPFREIQLHIDGNLAGVVWPFPIIFTGGVVPGLWRPIVGIDTFDLREHEIDISPWLPILCDGEPHSLEIRVVGLDDSSPPHGSLSKTVGNSWVVTGKLFLWVDEPGWVTKGSMPVASQLEPQVSLSSSVGRNASGANDSLSYAVHVNRHLSIISEIITSSGVEVVSWNQKLRYSNNGELTNQGSLQVIDQRTNGIDKSATDYSTTYSYPIRVNTSYDFEPYSGNFTIDATIDRGLQFHILGQPIFSNTLSPFIATAPLENGSPGFDESLLTTTQNGSAHYLSIPSMSQSFGFGTTEQQFTFAGLPTLESGSTGDQLSLGNTYEIYNRQVLATNGTVIRDKETLLGNTHISIPHIHAQYEKPSLDFAKSTVKSLLGRGPT